MLPALSVAVQVAANEPIVEVLTGSQLDVQMWERSSVAFASTVAASPRSSDDDGLMVGLSPGLVASYFQNV